MLGLSGKSTAVAAGALALAVAASSGTLRGDGPKAKRTTASAGRMAAATPAQLKPSALDVSGRVLWEGADPWVLLHNGQYFWCHSTGDRIEVSRSDRLDARGQQRVVWTAPRVGWNRAQVWAPELHFVRGRWYIYYAASGGRNVTHRMGVLECEGSDPLGRWIDRGMLYTGDDPAARRDNEWAIDGTILERGNKLYFIWSGWEHGRDVQYLYAAPMSDPATIAGPRVKLCANDTHLWERVGESAAQRGLHEGPAILRRNGRIFLVYSCSGSWQTSYKLGMLVADERADLLDPKSWAKVPQPVFAPTRDVYGVGHCSFTTSPDGRQHYIVYHSKTSRREGWDRVVRVQRFAWTEDGWPDFGRPMPDNVGVAVAE
jgi:GH43 family beta-xylosidase